MRWSGPGLGILLVLTGGQWACSASDGADDQPAGAAGNATSMSGAAGVAGSGNTSAGAGGAAGNATAGAGGSSGAAGSGGAALGAYCGTELAPPRKHTKTKVSDKVYDFVLEGAPGAQHKKVLLLMFNASSKNASTPDMPAGMPGWHGFYTAEQLGDTYFNDPDGVAAFLSEASYGQVSMSGRVVGWLDQPAGSMPAALDFQMNRESYMEQAAMYATFNDYDVIYMVALTDGTDSLQVGWQGNSTAKTSQGDYNGGMDWMINSTFFTKAGQAYPFSTILPSRSWAHELHHTLGLFGHDISMDCGTKTLDKACAFNGYGNVYSLMGESALGNHPSIGMKGHVGWLGPQQLPKIMASGQTVICPSETIDDKPKGLEIPLKTPLTITSTTVNMPSEFNRIYVEYRTALGFDHYLDRLTDASWQRRFLTNPRNIGKDGVVITLGYSNAETQSSILLDTHPTITDFTQDGIYSPGNAGKFIDAMLLVGETFELPEQGIKITPVALEGGGIKLDVVY